MSRYITHHETRDCPEEAASNDPVYCATCGESYDADDDTDMFIEGDDGKIYCNTPCGAAMRAKWHRQAVADELIPELLNLQKLACDLSERYNEANDGVPDNPILMLEDIEERLKAFSEGRDSGWREYPVILEEKEAETVELALMASTSYLLAVLQVEMVKLQPTSALCHIYATRLATAGIALLTLREARQRGQL